jgi:hypothetical protein
VIKKMTVISHIARVSCIAVSMFENTVVIMSALRIG